MCSILRPTWESQSCFVFFQRRFARLLANAISRSLLIVNCLWEKMQLNSRQWPDGILPQILVAKKIDFEQSLFENQPTQTMCFIVVFRCFPAIRSSKDPKNVCAMSVPKWFPETKNSGSRKEHHCRQVSKTVWFRPNINLANVTRWLCLAVVISQGFVWRVALDPLGNHHYSYSDIWKVIPTWIKPPLTSINIPQPGMFIPVFIAEFI